MKLHQAFVSTIKNYSANQPLTEHLWNEVVKSYTDRKRHYHNLDHLENMLAELSAVKNEVVDWDTLMMSLVYHDIIYKATAKDNEEKSASIARDRLMLIHFPEPKINKCSEMILATKGHAVSSDHEVNLFTDADLSILGKPWDVYQQYVQSIRKEYSVYPDILYKPGRKKVLQHFLAMQRIFKTDSFYQQYEDIARQNLQQELAFLNK
jgi:predicted metal-dependent HD superfamily phosphohydrolase